MRNSLLFKLLGAFLLVIVIGGLIIGFSTWQATRSAFLLYTTRVSQTLAETLVTPLAEYYKVNESWNGVDLYITANLTLGMPMMGAAGQGAMGHGMGQGLGKPSPNQRIILADPGGVVVHDSANILTGQPLTDDQLGKGVPISVSGQLAGTLIVVQEDASPLASAAATFLLSVNRSILVAAMTASLIAVLLGILLFRQITAPLGKLKTAAGAISRGDLSQRIRVKTNDELGDLGLAFNHMADDLQNAQTQRRRMIADIAHELRTPLTVVQANLEGMLDGVIPADSEHLAILHEESLLLNRLISDLRLLSIAESGELVLEKQSTDLSRFLPGLLDKFKPAALEKSIRLEYHQDSDLPSVIIDSDRIAQVVTNLVANALNYTPEKGEIKLSASAMENEVRVSVCDNGSGIPAGELPLVFERFYRVDKSRARKSGGSGLGLAIARQLVEAHGGHIKADSPVYEDQSHPGTCISFSLPNIK
ncbi:MAG: HAMP domain-containing protein [Anaerolineaceae bacterium]|nr:HAMP domain-containing protein [Anaerolineaceae bacterium]